LGWKRKEGTIGLQLLKIKNTKQHDINSQGKDYFIGDIHGQYRLLFATLQAINFNFSSDRLFAVGDVIDRGDESEKCLELLIEPWFNSVLGNHEHLFLQAVSNPLCRQFLLENGGQWINKWLDTPSQLFSWAHLVRIMMPLTMSVKTQYGVIGIAHANCPESWHSVSDLSLEDLLYVIWQRQNFQSKDKMPITGIDAVFHGHNQVKEPVVINNQIWADTLQLTGSLTVLSAQEVFNRINK